MYKSNFSIPIFSECVKAAWAKFGIKVWPGAGKVKDRTNIMDFTDLEQDDQGGFPVNSPDCQVLDQSVNNTWKNLKGGLNDKFQKRKPSRRTNGGFVNDVLSSWEEMKSSTFEMRLTLKRKSCLRSLRSKGVLLLS